MSAGDMPAATIGEPTFSVALSWNFEAAQADADLDLGCVLVDGSGFYLDSAFLGRSTTSALTHSGDARAGHLENGSDAQIGLEVITVNTAALSPSVAGIYFTGSAYNVKLTKEGEDFKRLASPGFLRIAEGAAQSSPALLAYDVDTAEFGTNVVIFFGLLKRTDNKWDVYDINSDVLSAGHAFTTGLNDIRNFYNRNNRVLLPKCKAVKPRKMTTTLYDFGRRLPAAPAAPTPALPADLSDDLFIQVENAQNLRAADSNGLSDPYVKIIHKRAGAVHATEKLNVVEKNLNPMWGSAGYRVLSGAFHAGDSVLIELWDKDMIGSDFLGSVEVPLENTTIFGPHVLALQGTVKGKPATGIVTVHFGWGPKQMGFMPLLTKRA